LITKILTSTAIALAAAAGIAAPAGADPSPFNVLSCDSCPQTVKKGGPPAPAQTNQSIQRGLNDLQGAPGQ
jgi:hypothetical protein